MVTSVLELLASGMTHDEVLADYPRLEDGDILACLAYAARLANFQFVPLPMAA